MTSGTVSFAFLLVIMPVIILMLMWTVWSIYSICQPRLNELDEWQLLRQSAPEFELETSLVGVRQIQLNRTRLNESLANDYSYEAGQSHGYGIPIAWIQDLGDRKN